MSESNEKWLNDWLMSRRTLLVFGSSAAAAAFLAACGDDDAADGDATDTTPGDTTPGDTTPGDTTPGDTTPADSTGATTPAATTGDTTPGTTPAAGGANAAQFGGGGGDGSIKIGFTAPLTGPLSGFGEANDFVLGAIQALVADGIMLGDQSYAVEFIVKDTQSNSDTAASQASSLILDDGVDMMISIATPEMINPVADQCEANGVPCLSTLAPWQPYFFGRGGDPAAGFDWTYHFFWGAEQLVAVFVDLWNQIETNKVVGLLCPNDPDGNALADPATGFPAGIDAGGFTMVDPGRFQTGNTDFSSIIGQFKDEGVEIVVGIPIPPDFATFWTQAKQQDFNPQVVTMAKAVLFSSAVEALGDIADGLASEVWWTPTHPFSSSLTGAGAQALSDEYTEATGKQWTQFVGFVHALLEVCLDSVARAGSTDKKALVDAIAATNLDTIVGPVTFNREGLPKNVSPTPLVGGQWQAQEGGAPFPFELLVVNNAQATEIPVGGTIVPLGS